MEDGTVGLIFVYVLQILLHEPCCRIEPLQRDKDICPYQIPRMVITDMGLLVYKYGRAAFSPIALSDHYVMHPTERSDVLLMEIGRAHV